MQALRKRLVIPAQFSEPREKLLAVDPWFLRESDLDSARDVASQALSVLTFTQSDFMPAFFDGVERSSNGRDAGAFETLIPHRDYAEPPDGTLDIHGDPIYPTSGAQAVRRLAPPPLETVAFDADEFPEKGDGVPHDDPPWLRKLYLPLHQHFHVVTTEVVCRRFGFPRLAKDRILEAGVIVRRLVRDRARQRWEDWISISEDEGLWLEIADRDMKPILAAPRDGSDRPLDPSGLPPGVFGGGDARIALMSRLGIRDEEALPTKLATHELSLIPAVVGDAAAHTALYGYLPLASPQRILPEPTVDGIEALKAALAERARSHLTRELLGQTPGATSSPAQAIDRMRVRIQGPIGELLDLLILPPAPSNATAAVALASVAAFPTGILVSPAIKKAVLRLAARVLLLGAMWELGDSSDARPGWYDKAADEAVVLAQSTPLPLGGWVKAAIASNPSAFKIVMADELHGIVERYLPAAGGAAAANVGADVEVRRVLAVALRRLRRCRIALAKDIYDNIFKGEADAPEPDKVRDGVPITTVGSLADELTAWIESDDAKQRELEPRPWPPLDLGTPERKFWVKVHQAGVELEAVLGEIDERGAGAGLAYADVLDARSKSAAKQLAVALELVGAGADETSARREMRVIGLDFAAQPERGVFVHPTFAPGPVGSSTTVEAFIDQVTEQYSQARAGETAEGLAARVGAEAKSVRDTTRPRFDSDSLYTAMAFVGAAGRDPCEMEQLVWSAPSDVFSLAEPTDVLGARPVAFGLPDLNKLIRDIPRIPKARAAPFAAVTTPPDSGVNVGESPLDTSRKFGISTICSFGIPVFTICAWILFSIIFSILIKLPGFMWMLLLKFCVTVRR